MNSILAQSYPDWELIAIDDHSTDTSAEIIRDYSHEDSRIKCLNTPGVGIVDALNFGVEKANSGIIARMDSDDLMRSTRLEEQLKYLKQKPEVDLVSSEVLQISDMAEGKIDWLRPLRETGRIISIRTGKSPTTDLWTVPSPIPPLSFGRLVSPATVHTGKVNSPKIMKCG